MRVDIHSHALINIALFHKNLVRKRKPPKFWNPLRNQIDIPRLMEADIRGVSFTIYTLPRFLPVKKHFQQAQKQIQLFHELIIQTKGAYEIALNGKELARILKQGKRAAFLSMEGAHSLERQIPRIEYFKRQGLFYITLTHFVPNGIANPCHTSVFTKQGITPLGKMLLRSMEKYSVLPDTAHLSDKAYADFIRSYNGPILCTHTGARKFHNIERNIPDWVLDEIKKRDGLVGVIAYPLYLVGKLRASTLAMAETAAYFADKIGVEKVAIGTDFDGYIFGPTDMRDITGWQNLENSLQKVGFHTKEIEQITGKNAVNFFAKYVM
ncbi:MAG: hypothetical protein D6767_08655 [Candidatus Hydrogenedentota bacterium]|nr:MAG: hypothetical protein D6767_08655 [Candidatus Hydrogenedentota bacterium]